MWKKIQGRVYKTIKEYAAEKPATSLSAGRIEKAIKAHKLMKRYMESESTVPVHFVVDEFEQIALVEVEQTQEEKETRERMIATGVARLKQLGDKPTKTAAEIADDAKSARDICKSMALDASTLLMFNVASNELSTDYADKFTDERYIKSQFGGKGKEFLAAVQEMAYICSPHLVTRATGLSSEEAKKYARMGVGDIIPALEKMKAEVQQSKSESESK